MISNLAKTNACGVITGANATLYSKLQHATVKLVGGSFTGSGVILALSIRSARTIVVATAAHNVRIFIEGQIKSKQREIWGRDPDGLTLQVMKDRKTQALAAFKAGAKIHYDATNWASGGDMTTPVNGKADIKDVILPDWQYDVCLLVADVELSMLPMYRGAESMTEVKDATELCRTLGYSVDLGVGYSLLQAGYGRTKADDPDSTGKLKFKLSELEDDGSAADYYDSLTAQSLAVFKLKSAADWTSHKGDSGGPLFAVNTVSGKHHTIGVTLGADVTTDSDEDTTWQSDDDGSHNNAVTSLARLYEAWDTGGGDPAAPLLANDFTF